MNPKPRERSDLTQRKYTLKVNRREGTYPLIVHDDNLLDTAEPAELVVQVTLSGTDTQAKDPQHGGGSGRLLCWVNMM